MGFVRQNGRPPQHDRFQMSNTSYPQLVIPRSEETGQHHVRLIQASCILLHDFSFFCLKKENLILILLILKGDLPKQSDEDAWSSPTSTSLQLFFDLTAIQSQVRPGHQLYLVSAKLRLFKLGVGHTVPSSATTGGLSEVQCGQPHADLFDLSSSVDEEKVRISVHNYTKPLKRHRGKKKNPLVSPLVIFACSN